MFKAPCLLKHVEAFFSLVLDSQPSQPGVFGYVHALPDASIGEHLTGVKASNMGIHFGTMRIYIYIYIHVHIYMWEYIYSIMGVYIYIYINGFTHTYIYLVISYIYIDISNNLWSGRMKHRFGCVWSWGKMTLKLSFKLLVLFSYYRTI